MTIEQVVQKLEPGSLVELYELDATSVGGGVVRFHAMKDGPIFWQGQEYSAWPIKAEGFELTSEQQASPTLMIGNVDGSISVLCLTYDDFIGCKLTRRRTFAEFLDAANFPGGNPSAAPDEERIEVYYVDRRRSETREAVVFELASPLDFQGMRLPGRQIIANHCPFTYRGEGCGYTGVAVANAKDEPTTVMVDDRCGKRLQSCELRKWPDGQLNFGGFPAAGLVRT